MQKLIYHIACSADGYIAHADHTVQGFLIEGWFDRFTDPENESSDLQRRDTPFYRSIKE